jgi:hypothetical protein
MDEKLQRLLGDAVRALALPRGKIRLTCDEAGASANVARLPCGPGSSPSATGSMPQLQVGFPGSTRVVSRTGAATASTGLTGLLYSEHRKLKRSDVIAPVVGTACQRVASYQKASMRTGE